MEFDDLAESFEELVIQRYEDHMIKYARDAVRLAVVRFGPTEEALKYAYQLTRAEAVRLRKAGQQLGRARSRKAVEVQTGTVAPKPVPRRSSRPLHNGPIRQRAGRQ
jgi:hypothetical protein